LERQSASGFLSKYAANTVQLDKLVGLAMLVAASVVFLYYTIWTLLMASLSIVSED
jgi:hypothetical protein